VSVALRVVRVPEAMVVPGEIARAVVVGMRAAWIWTLVAAEAEARK
jgi:hypothetical protein